MINVVQSATYAKNGMVEVENVLIVTMVMFSSMDSAKLLNKISKNTISQNIQKILFALKRMKKVFAINAHSDQF
jgi:ABC-type transport system involved in cytochrome bd biosynthesis fused ATPase/permease subunit